MLKFFEGSAAVGQDMSLQVGAAMLAFGRHVGDHTWMFGHGKKNLGGATLTQGLADLAGPDGRVELPPDSPAPASETATPPADVPSFYRDAGVDLPGLRAHQGAETGVTVWRAASGEAYAAADAWAQLRDLHPHTGLWPVLVTPKFWDEFGEWARDPNTDRGDGRSWLNQHLGYEESAPLASEIPRRPDLPWQQEEDFDWQDMVAGYDDRPNEIVLVPAAASWLVPGALAWEGAINYGTVGPDHASVLRRWSANYGAELVLLGLDIIALRVAHPPTDKEAALLAAVETVAYCPDAVFQGTGSLEALATALTAPLWRFWWD